ncbi:MAG TPA: DUF465 domain-containing protein [Gammaproteobacteria bacterium]|nr:DUF465 domain-containing protein [Gammaproteobacteria bacterium]
MRGILCAPCRRGHDAVTTATAGTGAAAINQKLTPEEIRSLRRQLEELTLEHRDLDDVIHHLIHSDYPDQLQLKRLKKRKLLLKDSINQLQSRLIPDLDA